MAPQEDKVRSQFLKIADDKNVKVMEVEHPSRVLLTESGTEFATKGLSYQSPMIGWHQTLNSSVAITAAQSFCPELKKETIDAGLQRVKWPGRLQRMSTEIPLYYDVAHNAHGLGLTIGTVREIFNQKPIGLFVMKGDKEIDLVATALENQFGQLIISGATEWGLLSGSQLSKKLSDAGLKEFEVIASFEKALNHVTTTVEKTNLPALVFGSHYVAKAIFNKFGFLF